MHNETARVMVALVDGTRRRKAGADTFTVWVQQANGCGTHHVSCHRVRGGIEAAKRAAIRDTLADWGEHYEASDLRVLGVCQGDVAVLEWNEGDG